MSMPVPAREEGAATAVAGLLSAAAIFASLLALVYRPFRVTPFTIAVSLVAVAMSGRDNRLATVALAVASACFVVGTTIAVVLGNPLF